MLDCPICGKTTWEDNHKCKPQFFVAYKEGYDDTLSLEERQARILINVFEDDERSAAENFVHDDLMSCDSATPDQVEVVVETPSGEVSFFTVHCWVELRTDAEKTG